LQNISGDVVEIVDKTQVGSRVLRYLRVYAKKVGSRDEMAQLPGRYIIEDPVVIDVYRKAVIIFPYNR
jgi:aldehyde:ferredoxin oxidoreductase